ncbi:hypothetical protein EWM62_15130 [Mucilaginibacter terrigena]|uniref:Lipocalin-like domain-containing protein n=1 Tax=Mucilaginibacter terrigena TaxID=2492395 RepID=A0A4V1ZBI1_9SPHI|nr:hypothetical protein [Mucilaginibacter terrigena]RYU87829.1 hypothetical protein EWM62_15130 [Mucilaginibacter terrigena]
MRIIKTLLAVFILIAVASCKKSETTVSLSGKWHITSALGNDDRHWTGSFTLKQEGGANKYTGLFLWDATDGQSTGTDSVTGEYNASTKVLIMQSVVISGDIEPVTYTMNVTDNGTKMHGTWTGSSDGSVADPGIWTAEKE